MHASRNEVASSILRVKEQTREEKQSLKQNREDIDKAKHEPAGVMNYKGNNVVLKQPHLRQEEPYKVKCKGLNIGQKCEGFTLVSILSNTEQNTFIWTAIQSCVSNTRHLSQNRPEQTWISKPFDIASNSRTLASSPPNPEIQSV